MSLKDTTKSLKALLVEITQDLDKAEGGNKAASQRVRTGTVKLEKTAKAYRKESISAEKHVPAKKSAKAPAKAAAKGKAAAAPAKKAAPKAAAKAPAKAAPKAAPKAAAKTSAHARPLAVKRPTAKLPARRTSL